MDELFLLYWGMLFIDTNMKFLRHALQYRQTVEEIGFP